MLVRIAVLVALAALTGCGDDEPAAGEPSVQTAAVPARGLDLSPAAASGGACQMLDFFAVEQFVGIQFEVAASADKDATSTCVLQRSNGQSFPDLTLTVSTTAVTPATFRTDAAPAGSSDLPGLGKAAYQLYKAAAAGADPAGPGAEIEIGWLTDKGQLIVLRYRMATTTPPAEAEAMLTNVVDLAKFLDPQ